MLSAIIVAGGSGQRMGFDKTFASLGGQPIVAHAVAAFEAASCVHEIIVVGRPERLPELEALVASAAFGKVSKIVAGGAQRQDSVQAGLRVLAAEATHVAVHDAARPLVRPEQIEAVYEVTRSHGAAALAAPVIDTLKRAGEDGVVRDSLERADVYAMQTPQMFERALLEEAFAFVAAKGLAITDEVSAAQQLGRAVRLVKNEDFNFKITFPRDLALAELVLQQRARLA